MQAVLCLDDLLELAPGRVVELAAAIAAGGIELLEQPAYIVASGVFLIVRAADGGDDVGGSRCVNAAKILGDIPDYHTTPVQAAQLANAAHVNTLVLYHLLPAPRNALMARMFVRGVDNVRPGTLLGEDGMLVTPPVRTKTVAVSRID